MRRYETIYILRPSLNEDEINTIIDNSNSILTGDSGQIIELDRWGMKKLAYPIKKEIQGFYVFCDYSGTPEAVGEMERKFRIDDAVLRYMTIKTADTINAEEVSEAQQQAATRLATAQEETESEVGDQKEESTPKVDNQKEESTPKVDDQKEESTPEDADVEKNVAEETADEDSANKEQTE